MLINNLQWIKCSYIVFGVIFPYPERYLCIFLIIINTSSKFFPFHCIRKEITHRKIVLSISQNYRKYVLILKIHFHQHERLYGNYVLQIIVMYYKSKFTNCVFYSLKQHVRLSNI